MEIFDTATRRRIQAAIRERAPDAFCPMCRSTSLSLQDGFVTLGLERGARGPIYSTTGLPSIALVCDQCGYTLLFNALALSLGDLLRRTAVAS